MSEQAVPPCRHSPAANGFWGRVARGLGLAVERALEAESAAARSGYLQSLDPRMKVVGLFAMIVGTVLTQSLATLGALFLLALLLAFVSRITLAQLCKQVWLGVLLFTGLIALPACFTVPGEAALPLQMLPVVATVPGVRSALFLVGRAETSATFACLLILSTPWTHVLKAMRALGVPVVVVSILGMTSRYVFVLLQVANETLEARRSRSVAPVRGAERKRMIAAAAGVLLDKAFHLSEEVHLAMISRGYRGEIHLLDEFRSRPRDWLALSLALAVPVLIAWQQR